MLKLPWRTKPLRHFALLDEHGICRAFRSASEQPASTLWVEVDHYHETWLNRPLTSCQSMRL